VEIHPTAIVDKGAVIGEGTQIGAFSMIGPNVQMGKNCRIHEHVVVRGHTTCGEGVEIYPFAVVGEPPQHLKYQGEPTEVVIGNQAILREMVTVHLGTSFGGGKTTIGDGAYLMAYTHVAHDCSVGKGVIIANAVQLGGHVIIEDYANLGGQSAVAQFCRIGRYCYLGGGSIIRKDLPPFLLGKGNDFQIQGINAIGLMRHGFSETTISHLKQVYRIFYLQHLTVARAIEKILQEVGDKEEVHIFLDFVRDSKQGLVR